MVSATNWKSRENRRGKRGWREREREKSRAGGKTKREAVICYVLSVRVREKADALEVVP